MIEGDRKLATIRSIAAIDAIDGADRIVCLTIDGWKLVSGKENFKVGDLAVYFEIDSFLPVREEFEFLRKGYFKSTKNLGDGFRIRTIKLRGQVSQGLALPIQDFFEFDEEKGWGYYQPDPVEDVFIPLEVGMDVTEYLNVQKYEKPIPANLAGTVRGNVPTFLRKTDQERVQNCFEGVRRWITVHKEAVKLTDLPSDVADKMVDCQNMVFADGTSYWKNDDGWYKNTFISNDSTTIDERAVFEETLKLDGSSMTVYHNEQAYGVCSRNLDLKRDYENQFWKFALDSTIISSLVKLGLNIAVQGELMGPGIQNNREGFQEHRLYIFDIFDIDLQRYMTPAERMTIAAQLISECKNLYHVPVISASTRPFDTGATVETILNHADTVASINVQVAEGVVFKSHMVDGPTFKAIANRFLLSEKD
jgi:hypothetical protein